MALGSTVRSAIVWELLRAALAQLEVDGAPLSIIDAGGGTGGFAVPLAELGHAVTVVDPSPDSLAALDRRAAERGLAQRIRAVQGDLSSLPALAPHGVDVVLVHSVLEVVDDPAAALAAVRSVLHPNGLLSVLVRGETAALVHRVLAGRLAAARDLLLDPRAETARSFTPDRLADLLREAGFAAPVLHGVRVFTDLVPGALLEDAAASATLLELERLAAQRVELLPLAAQLHAFGRSAGS